MLTARSAAIGSETVPVSTKLSDAELTRIPFSLGRSSRILLCTASTSMPTTMSNTTHFPLRPCKIALVDPIFPLTKYMICGLISLASTTLGSPKVRRTIGSGKLMSVDFPAFSLTKMGSGKPAGQLGPRSGVVIGAAVPIVSGCTGFGCAALKLGKQRLPRRRLVKQNRTALAFM